MWFDGPLPLWDPRLFGRHWHSVPLKQQHSHPAPALLLRSPLRQCTLHKPIQISGMQGRPSDYARARTGEGVLTCWKCGGKGHKPDGCTKADVNHIASTKAAEIAKRVPVNVARLTGEEPGVVVCAECDGGGGGGVQGAAGDDSGAPSVDDAMDALLGGAGQSPAGQVPVDDAMDAASASASASASNTASEAASDRRDPASPPPPQRPRTGPATNSPPPTACGC